MNWNLRFECFEDNALNRWRLFQKDLLTINEFAKVAKMECRSWKF